MICSVSIHAGKTKLGAFLLAVVSSFAAWDDARAELLLEPCALEGNGGRSEVRADCGRLQVLSLIHI